MTLKLVLLWVVANRSMNKEFIMNELLLDSNTYYFLGTLLTALAVSFIAGAMAYGLMDNISRLVKERDFSQLGMVIAFSLFFVWFFWTMREDNARIESMEDLCIAGNEAACDELYEEYMVRKGMDNPRL